MTGGVTGILPTGTVAGRMRKHDEDAYYGAKNAWRMVKPRRVCRDDDPDVDHKQCQDSPHAVTLSSRCSGAA